ncbi:putative glycoside hydrolase family 27 protein [Phaeoacremonium minimum UCRPA7]|uniref:alpha-galactosidase n=1 Tax=Phaeoacremonium minimum (strain UCR-PA7) TaxID=1286976 RepID=R8BDY5_PHAM7|nr:putative glycoside hydrolase family 27 protein [Phaeoacremonium minimum UCRPA7]EON97516.1 putative glycoside hydrolase family 27 protein [Phaeoacremonium minimum UCRPA7]
MCVASTATDVFDTMSVQDFAAKLHANGMKLGLYMIPGAFQADENKTVAGTDFVIGDLFNKTVDGRTGISNTYNCRNDFDYSKPGVQEWHDSVVEQFASWGVDFIKLDYVTPGSSLGDGNDDLKPANDSGAVAAMHSAISRLAPSMRLDISWKLDREQPFFDLWKHNADALRLDQDINFGKNPVTWDAIQRTVEQYRQFINQQVLDPSRQNQPIMIRPDMDNLVVATDASASSWSGFNTVERYGQMILWLGAGAKLVVGSDMTQIDDLGRTLLTNEEVLDVAAFTANWPMVPKQPADRAAQLQAWVAGPDGDGTAAVVVLSNLGPDLGQSGYSDNLQGDQLVNVTLDTLGIEGI